MSEDELMTITAAAEALGVSRTTIYAMIERGDLKAEAIPYLRRAALKIPRAQVDAWLQKRRGD